MKTIEIFPKYQILVLGVGNILRSDDGIGNVAAGLLRELKKWPESVEFLEVGTAMLNYLREISLARRLIIIDAIQAGGKPGSIYRYEQQEDLELFYQDDAESHGLPLAHIIEWARALTGWPARVVIYGVEPASLDLGSRISHPVMMALSALISHLATEIKDVL